MKGSGGRWRVNWDRDQKGCTSRIWRVIGPVWAVIVGKM